jgi:hypothetical protein
LEKLFDPIRRRFVSPLPEEKVRQNWILQMIQELGFPKSLIGVEKDIFRLPHLQGKEKFPIKRRADILCFAKNLHPDYPAYPLLLIECKATPLTEATIRQVIGYNHVVKAYFVAIANAEEIRLFVPKKEGLETLLYLPPYEQLLRSITP